MTEPKKKYEKRDAAADMSRLRRIILRRTLKGEALELWLANLRDKQPRVLATLLQMVLPKMGVAAEEVERTEEEAGKEAMGDDLEHLRAWMEEDRKRRET